MQYARISYESPTMYHNRMPASDDKSLFSSMAQSSYYQSNKSHTQYQRTPSPPVHHDAPPRSALGFLNENTPRVVDHEKRLVPTNWLLSEPRGASSDNFAHRGPHTPSTDSSIRKWGNGPFHEEDSKYPPMPPPTSSHPHYPFPPNSTLSRSASSFPPLAPQHKSYDYSTPTSSIFAPPRALYTDPIYRHDAYQPEPYRADPSRFVYRHPHDAEVYRVEYRAEGRSVEAYPSDPYPMYSRSDSTRDSFRPRFVDPSIRSESPSFFSSLRAEPLEPRSDLRLDRHPVRSDPVSRDQFRSDPIPFRSQPRPDTFREPRSEHITPEWFPPRSRPDASDLLKDMRADLYRNDEYTLGSRRSDLHRSEMRRVDPVFPAHKAGSQSPPSTPGSPASSPPSPYKRTYDPFATSHEVSFPFTQGSRSLSPNAKKLRVAPPAPAFTTPESRTPSPSGTHHAPTTGHSPTTTSATAPLSPIFTMETPGGTTTDGAKISTHPKNPVKFEFKDFKENEYTLHSLQNSANGGTSLLSLKQQKRHKRIINRALAQGQARARERAAKTGGGALSGGESPSPSLLDSHPPNRVKQEVDLEHAGKAQGQEQHESDEQKRRKRQSSSEHEHEHEHEQEQEQEKHENKKWQKENEEQQKPKSHKKQHRIHRTETKPHEQSHEQESTEGQEEGQDSELKEQKSKSHKKTLQSSGENLFEQFGSFEELQRNMIPKPPTRSSTRLRTKSMVGQGDGKFHCMCKRPETDSMVQCDSCDKWFHFECVGLTEAIAQEIVQYFCAECRGRGSLTKKVCIEDLISESEEPPRQLSPSPSSPPSSTQDTPSLPTPPMSPKEASEDLPIADQDLDELPWDADEDTIVPVGDGVVSISSLAKQPWLDGWVTARSLAVRYLQEAKMLGHEITENRRLPKQVAVRMSNKGKRAWRQAEVLLAIQFLKTSDLVETSTKKGTLVREPCKTMDDLITRAKTIGMPNRNNIGKVKVVDFARQRQLMLEEKEREKERSKEKTTATKEALSTA